MHSSDHPYEESVRNSRYQFLHVTSSRERWLPPFLPSQSAMESSGVQLRPAIGVYARPLSGGGRQILPVAVRIRNRDLAMRIRLETLHTIVNAPLVYSTSI